LLQDHKIHRGRSRWNLGGAAGCAEGYEPIPQGSPSAVDAKCAWALGAITMELHPHGPGDNRSRKTTEKAAGPANKDHIYSGYGKVFGSAISSGSGQLLKGGFINFPPKVNQPNLCSCRINASLTDRPSLWQCEPTTKEKGARWIALWT
jgi:hypothetical protein